MDSMDAMDKRDTQAEQEQVQSATIKGENGLATQTEEILVAPGISIIRSNTPRPISFTISPSSEERTLISPMFQAGSSARTDFPVQAPVAPPLPELTGELEEPEEKTESGQAMLLGEEHSLEKEKSEASAFSWLFEYGLEMEPTYLNSRERLDGQAYRYGPAVVKGYRLHGIELPGGQIVPTLVKSEGSTQEVWGVLYRIPHRLLERAGQAHSRLDLAHPIPLFAPVTVTAQETYRKREVPCVTYMATSHAGRAFAVFPAEQRRLDSVYAQQLLACARQQELPESYLAELTAFAEVSGASDGHETHDTQHGQVMVSEPGNEANSPQKQRAEQNTEPLPTFLSESPSVKKMPGSAASTLAVIEPRHARRTPSQGWLVALALYLALLLVATLVLAVMQALGYWVDVFTPGFAPLGIPWYVLLYGLLGGCIGGMMGLGNRASQSYPIYAILTWFARPFVGVALAALVYLLLNSGPFALSLVPMQRYALFAIAGALAGMSERWLFLRRA